MENKQPQTPLAREIARLPKKSIVDAMKSLNLPLSTNGTKEKYSNDFVKGIYDIIQKNKIIPRPVQSTLHSIFQTVKQHGIISALKKNFQNGFEQPVRQSPHTIRKNFNLIENQKDKLRCICDNTKTGQTMQCVDCYQSFHTSCLKIPKSQKFECPFCFAKNMDPLNQVKQVLFCGFMSSQNRIHRIPFNYNPSPDQQKLQVQIRCLRLDGKNNYSITYPDYGDVKLGQYKILQLKPLAQNSSLKKRKDQIRIIQKRCLRTNNILLISQGHSYSNRQVRVGHYNHFLMVCLVKQFTNQQLFTKVVHSNNFVEKYEDKNKLQGDLEMQKVYVELKCPLSFNRIKIPVKGRECVHDTCVDLQSLIVMNKSANRQWRCPICKKKSHQLVVNEVLSKIIKENSHLNLAGVTFNMDGTFTLTQQKADDSDSDQYQNKKAPLIINIDDSDQSQFLAPVLNNQISTQDNQLNLPIDAPIVLGDNRQDSSVAPIQWQMDSFHHNPITALVTDFNEKDVFVAENIIEENQNNDKNKQKQLTRSIDNMQIVNPDPAVQIPQIPQHQPSIQEQLLIPQLNNDNGFENQNDGLNKMDSKISQQKEPQIQLNNQTVINPINIEDEEDIVILHIPKKTSQYPKVVTFPQQAKNPNKQSTLSNVIDIIDSDQETEQQKVGRYIRSQVFQLKQMLLQKNVNQTLASANQIKIVEGIAKKLINLCI